MIPARLLLLTAVLAAPAFGKPKPLTPAAFYDRESPKIATVEFVQEFLSGGQRTQTRGTTDGVVISPDGLVLISGNVRFPQSRGGQFAGGSRPELRGFTLHFADGRKLDAEPITFDDELNLGLLQIQGDPEDLPHVRFRDGYVPKVGDALRSITLYTEEYGRTPVLVTAGVNALLTRPQEVWSVGGASSNLLGAPLWDERGEVVGVVAQVPIHAWAATTAIPELTGPVGLSYDRFGAWLDKARAQAAAAQAPEDAAETAWIGILYEPLPDDLGKHLGISPGGGIVLSSIVPGSPAAAAGLQPLDVLVALDGARIAVRTDADTSRFAADVRKRQPGETAVFTRERPGGAQDEVRLALVPSPRSELRAERRTDKDFDLTVREVTLDNLLAQRLDPDTRGVIVDGVTGAGWAGLAGLSPGLLVQRINDHDVTDLPSFEAAMAAIKAERPDKVLFFVRYARNTRFLVAEPDWSELTP